jgi:amiloride-sensitive sodium channel
MIFNPNDYPDNTSGGVTETLISLGTENFLELNAVSFFTEKAVRHFDVNDRKCIFKDEISALYNAYTYSDCIVDCKVKNIWDTCGCQPFFYPIRGKLNT